LSVNTRRFGWFLVLFIFFIFALDAGNLYWGWQRHVSWFDSPMHFLGGAWVTLASIWFFTTHRGNHPFNQRFFYALTALFVISVFWEAYEAFFNFLRSGLWTFNATDTAKDLFCNYLGAILAIYFTKQYVKQ